MRWKGIYLVLGITLILGIIGVFFLDTIIRWSFENAIETVTGAQVDIEKLHLSLRNLTIKIANLQIANPRDTWRNLIETDDLKLGLEAEPLFSGKIVITEITIGDLKFNSKRKTNGKLKSFILPGPFGEAQAKLRRDIANAPILDTSGLKQELKPDQLLDSYRFKTRLSADAIRADIETTRTQWQANMKQIDDLKSRLIDIRVKFNIIRESKIESVPDIQEKLKQLKEFQSTVKQFQSQTSQTGQDLQNDFTAATTKIKDLKQVAEEDFRALKKLAKLPDFQSVNLAELLFGETLLNESTVFVELIDKLQAYIPEDPNAPKTEKHPRGGVDISFPGRKTYPRLLIREITVSGSGSPDTKFNGYAATGRVTGITNEPQVYGRPLTVALDGKAANHATLDLDGVIHQDFKHFAGQFQIKLGQLPIPDLKLHPNRYLPAKIATGNGEVLTKVNLRPGFFRVNLTFNGRDLVSDYSGHAPPEDLGTEIIREVLSKIDVLLINYQLEGQNKKLHMKLSSNIDEVISARFKAVIGAKFDAFIQKLRDRVDAELREKQTELEARRTQYFNEFNAKIAEVKALAEQQQAELEQKKTDLEEQLKAKTKSKIPFLNKFKF